MADTCGAAGTARTLYFRYVIPPDVRGALGTSELSISLGTSSKRGAELAALELRLVAKRCVEHARDAIHMNKPVERNSLRFTR